MEAMFLLGLLLTDFLIIMWDYYSTKTEIKNINKTLIMIQRQIEQLLLISANEK